jgi:hypothetical protein
MKKRNLENADLAERIGNYTYLKILWKSWKKELPPQFKQIFVVVKLKGGYFPMTGTYLEWTSEERKDNKGKVVFPPHTFRYVRFDEFRMPEIYLGSKEEKMLISWGMLETHTPTYS